MPRRAAARRRSCHSGRMKLIVMPSSHHLQLILSSPMKVGRGECGRAQLVEPGILCGAGRKRQALSASSTGKQRLWACLPELSKRSSQSNSNIRPPNPMTTLVATLIRARMCVYVYFR